MIQIPPGYTSRAVTPDDIDTITELVAAADLHDDGVVEVDRDDIVPDFGQLGFDPAADAVLVLDGDDPVAWADAYREKAEVDVRPSHRGRGLGAALLAWSEEWARARELPTIGQTKTDANVAARELFSANGYEPTHTAWIIRMALDAAPPPPEVPPGITMRTFNHERDARDVHEVIDASFSEWPGRDPDPFESWSHVLAHPAFAPDLSVIAFDGDEVVGVLLAYDYPEVDEGWVQQLATKASHRKRGIATAMLQTAFAGFHGHGRHRCGVSTDSRTGALPLYERIGMRVERSYTRYKKQL